ncbi:MAG: hypothetical protein IKP66_04825, partial [Lachnospiraceae bacterium]|nr:hypothetical protein [Lachnospiraceae bacterium]
CIILDDIYDKNAVAVALENNNVIIKLIQQVHKLCGAASGKACSHLAVSSHTSDVTFKGMSDDFKTTGSYFLGSNRTLTKNITLTGALNLCLNGYTLNFDKYQILGNYNLTICDCKGTGKITVGENKAELFKNTKVVLFGNSDSKKMSVEGYRIYYTDSGSSYSFYASNVHFTGKKAAGLNNDGAFYTNSQDTLTFANCLFTNFVGKTLFHSVNANNKDISFYGTNEISGNTATNYLMYIQTANTITINANSTLNIKNNTITTDTAIPSIIHYESGTIKNLGTLNIENNTFKKGTANPTRMSALFMTRSSKIEVTGSSIKINNNTTSISGGHVYQIYSQNTDGIIEAVGSGKFKTGSSKFTPYFESEDGGGVVFKNWTANSVDNVNKYLDVIGLDTLYSDEDKYGLVEIELLSNNVVLNVGHKHFICGNKSGNCTHDGIENHTVKYEYEKYTPGTMEIPTRDYYYINNNILIERDITLTGDLYLCLNGFSLDMNNARFIGNAYSIYICDCKGKGKIETDNETALFDNVSVNLYGNKNGTLPVSANRVFTTTANHTFTAFRVDFTGNGDSVSGNIFNFTNTSSLIFNTVSIKNYRVENNGIFSPNAHIMSFYGDNSITNNVVQNSIYEVEGNTLNIHDKSKLNIENNEIIINNEVTGGIILSNNSIFYELGDLSIVNNEYKVGSIMPTHLSGIHAIANSKVYTKNTKINIKNNETNGEGPQYHIYDVYSTVSLGLFEILEGGVFKSEESEFKVYLNTENNIGNVFNNYTLDTVDLIYGYVGTIKLDSKYDDIEGDYEYYMTRNDTALIVSRSSTHSHKLCGGDECSHIGIEAHTEDMEYSLLHNDVLLYNKIEFPSSGVYYLTSNVTLSKPLNITGDLSICLNGYSIEETGAEFFKGAGSNLNICDCVGSGSIKAINMTGNMFDNLNTYLYGVSSETKMTVRSSSLMNVKNQSLVLSNVHIEGNGKTIDTLINEDNVGNIVLSNVDINNVVAKTLYKSNKANEVKLYGENRVYSNKVSNAMFDLTGTTFTVTSGSSLNIDNNNLSTHMFNLNNSTLNVEDSSLLKVNENTLTTDTTNDISVINLGSNRNIFNEFGRLEIVDNQFYVGSKGANVLSAVSVNRDSMINTFNTVIIIGSSSVAVKPSSVSLRTTGAYHVFDMYSKNVNGFIEAVGGLFNTEDTSFTVYLSSSNGSGRVFLNWDSPYVDSKLGYKDCIRLDEYYSSIIDTTYGRIIDGDGGLSIIIAYHASHMVCGRDDKCTHESINEHEDIYTYELLTREDVLYGYFPTRHAYYFNEDIALNGDVVLEDDLFICLNGHSFDMGEYVFNL